MITKSQIDTLSNKYQIDKFTIMREFLQLIFLSYLYQHKKAKQIYFKGGTAIRLLLASPRFSEDLDFSTPYQKVQIKLIVQELEKKIQKELPKTKISLLYSGKTGIRFRIKYQSLDFKYPITIRLDFTIVKEKKEVVISPLVTEFPITIFPLVVHLSGNEILAEKICALATRNKGRDFFDVWYLLEKGILPDQRFINKSLLRKIESFPQNRLDLDLAQFLPKSQKQLTKILIKLLKRKFDVIFQKTNRLT